MSFEVFLQSYADKKPLGISRTAMAAAFGVRLTEESATCWKIDFGGGNDCHIYVDDDRERVASAMVSRPIADSRLWDALFNVMQLGNVVVFWPGGKAPLVVDASVIRHLPEGMVESLGKPICIRSGSEMLDHIKFS